MVLLRYCTRLIFKLQIGYCNFQPEPGNGTMRSNMFGYAGAPMPLPRLRPPGTSTISHAFRTPESSTSEEEDRTDLLGRSFQTSRPKSRSSLAVSVHIRPCTIRVIYRVGARKNRYSTGVVMKYVDRNYRCFESSLKK